MAEHPPCVVHEHTLPDGRRVRIRPMREDDEPLETRFMNDLSAESRYLRFQKAVRTPSEGLIRLLTRLDDLHLVLVCVVLDGDREKVVGEARYIVNPDGKSCEFAVVIADEWHKTGIAGLLMGALIEAARGRGLSTMEGQVLSWNRGMLRFARGLGFEVRHAPDDPGIVRVVKKL